jgi:Protein of unknown function (DUF3082)
MTNSSDQKQDQVNVSPWRCWLGSSIAGSLAVGAYFLMTAIANAFASKPLSTTNITALNIGVAVRTLVVGITALATGVSSLIALGLFALGIQMLLKKKVNDSN